MLSKEFLTKQIPVLKTTDSGSFALSQMEDLKLKHLPVVKENQYICLLSEKDVFLMNNPEDHIENITWYAPCVGEETSVLEVLNIMGKNKLSLLPVVGASGEFLGAVTLGALTEKLSEISNAGSHGALIAIELNTQDYSLSQIVHLTESNNAKILSLFSYPVEATAKMILLLKIDLEDASPVLMSLERFNYKVLYYAQKQGLMDETMKSRLDELMYYLEM